MIETVNREMLLELDHDAASRLCDILGKVPAYTRLRIAEAFANHRITSDSRLRDLEAELDEAVNWSALVDQHGTDGFDALADHWLAMVPIQRMLQALSSTFAKYADEQIMIRFREQMQAIAHAAFVEGCIVGVRAELALRAHATQGGDSNG